jgi:gliding motility-associated-like protein
MLRKIFFFILLLCSGMFAYSSPDSLLKVISGAADPGLKFTENLGQWDAKILFRAQLDGGALFVERNCLTFNFYNKKKLRSMHFPKQGRAKYDDLGIKGHAYKVHFEGCNLNSTIGKQETGTDYENFFLGSDQSKWKGNVPNYHRIFLRDLYNNVDYEAVTAINGIKYNFHVKPGADVSRIKMRYEGVDKPVLDKGTLRLKLSVNEVMEYKPFSYQMINGKIKEVRCAYILQENVLTFSFPDGYDKSQILVIDPVLVFAAQSGSPADNFGMTATFDPQGNLYSGGTVFDVGYPTTTGAWSSTYNGPYYDGNSDVFITKYSANGTALIYSTYLGGQYSETVNSMIVDINNNLCFFGVTSSSNFPMLTNSYDNTFNGGQFIYFYYNGQRFVNGTDIYVCKLNSTGSSVLASTFLGGSGNDGLNHTDTYPLTFTAAATPPSTGFITIAQPAYDSLLFNYGDQCRGEIQLDAMNNIYIASSTRSSNFPTANGFDNTLGGKQDGVIAKLNSNLSSLLYSSYIGGSSVDACYGIIVQSNFEAYITGGTCSNNMPNISGGYQNSYQGGRGDGFILRVNAAGNGVLNGTYFGTSGYDQSYFIQSDKYQNIYIYGQSLGNVPIVVATNASTVFNVPGTHQFIARFNSSLNTLNLCTKFGNYTNNVDISPSAFAVDKCNNIYLSGWGGSLLNTNNPLTNMPLFAPTQSTTSGYDFYFMGLDSNATGLKYGSYFGGGLSAEHVDGGTSRFDPKGRIYQSVCAGCGGNDDFPVTSGAWPNTPGNPNHANNCNNGVIKLDFQLVMSVATINTNTLTGCSPLVVTFTNSSGASGPGSSYTWYLGNGVVTSTSVSPTMTYNTPGTYSIALVVRDNLTCNKIDSNVTYVTVTQPLATVSANYSQCSNTVALTHTSTGVFGSNPYAWNFGDGTPLGTSSAPGHTYATNGNFNVTFTLTDANGCKAIKTTTVTVFNFIPLATNSVSACEGAVVTLTASGGTSYLWSPGGNTSSSLSFPATFPNSVYTVQVSNTSPGYLCTKTMTAMVNTLAAPLVDFNSSSTLCTNTVVLTNNSSGTLNAAPYSWDFGDGGTSTIASPVHVYSSNGTFTVKLIVTGANGCTSILTKTVAAFNFQPGAVSNGSLCYGKSISLNASGGTSYTWSPSASLQNPQSASPVASPTASTIYTVDILNDSQGYNCFGTRTTQVNVFPTPTTAFSFSINPCGGGVYFYDLSKEDVQTWTWTLSPVITKTVQNPYNFYNKGGTFTVALESANEYGCSDLQAKSLTVPEPPPLTVSNATDVCLNNSVILHAGGGIKYHWTPSETLNSPDISDPVATPRATTEYSVEITTTDVVNGEPCVFVLTTGITVWRLSVVPVSAIAKPALIITGNSTTLYYLGDPGATVTWYPIGSTTPLTGYTVTAKPEIPTTYTAVATRGACTENVEVHVDAFTEGCLTKDVFVPNTFTPNDDGNNDRFMVRGLKIDELYFAVYNRWGEMVFEAKDKTTGWDGSYKGKPAEVGVYGWYLQVKCINGDETFRKGNVTLIR